MLESIDITQDIPRGGMRQFDLHIAKLPTGTIVNIHVFVYRGQEDGPVVMLSGGLHGDEINGVEIIRSMIDSGKIHPQRGTIVAVPVLNIYGFLNFARDLPDGKDANRSFPGTRNGSLASRVAWHVQKRLLPIIDYGVDFHTGGGDRSNYPQIRCDFSDAKALELAHKFAPPFIVNSPLIPNSLRSEAKNQGKSLIVYETGEAMRFDKFGIQEGIRCTRRLMEELDMIDRDNDLGKPWEPIEIKKTSWIRAEEAGLFHPRVEEGSHISQGQKVGLITAPYNSYNIDLIAPQDGYVIGLNHSPVINAGDALLHIGLTEDDKPDNEPDKKKTGKEYDH